MKRRLRIWKIATCITMGAYVMQLGGCFAMGANTLLASTPFGTILTDLGIPGVCGTPNFVIFDAMGEQQGDIFNTEDDLVFFCPVTVFVQAPADNGG